jgi:hypothetical protein
MIFGDGDFSFSKAFVKTLQQRIQILNKTDSNVQNNLSPNMNYHILSTSYDTKDVVINKYINSIENIEYVVNSGLGNIEFGIDAMTYRHKSRIQEYNVAVFNFPFADVKNNSNVRDGNVVAKFDTMYVYKGRHMNLIQEFFQTCFIQKFTYVVITLLLSQAVVWEIERIALKSGYNLVKFLPVEAAYHSIYSHGYQRKRTYLDSTFPDDGINDEFSAWCFCFSVANENGFN